MAVLEDKLPESVKKNAYHPSEYVYAFKKSYCDKLFDELLLNNLAILGFEVWIIEDGVVEKTVPMQDGQIEIYSGKYQLELNEQWYDFVERTVKKTADTINLLNLEKNVRLDLADKVYYHFKLAEK
jgi:hypothetical protein